MQIKELPHGKQYTMHETVVNVPTSIETTIQTLPRTNTMMRPYLSNWKKKQNYKSHDYFQNIRPRKIMIALQWLLENSALYKNANININRQWLDNYFSQASSNGHCHEETHITLADQKQNINQNTKNKIPDHNHLNND